MIKYINYFNALRYVCQVPFNPSSVGAIIILAVEPQNKSSSYTSGVHKENPMIILITIFTILFALGSVSPLLVTEDMQDIVILE
jgi:hypothetical protein